MKKNTTGGGGGSYATAGSIGGLEGSCTRGSGSTVIYGSQTLDKLYFGGAGGGSYSGNSIYRSGGIINIDTKALFNNGSILNNGDAGTGTGNESAGSGAGGSVRIVGEDITAGTITATGGLGFSWYNGAVGNNTGAGGAGRIAIYYGNSVSGTTTPSAYQLQQSFNDIGVTIGGQSLTSIQLVDSSTITGTTVVHSAGVVDVVVKNYDGQSSTLTGGFEYLPANFILNNIPQGLTVLNTTDWTTNLGSAGVPASTNVTLGIKNKNHRIAVFDVLLNNDQDWSGIVADSNTNKSIFYYPSNFTAIPGRNSSSYILYVPEISGSLKVGVCPGATQLSDINISCNGFYYLVENQTLDGVTATIANEDGVNYWKLAGLTISSGAMGDLGYVVVNPPENITIVSATDNSTQVTEVPQSGTEEVLLKTLTGNTVASFDVLFSVNDKDWTGLTVQSSSSKSLFHYTGGFSNLPGSTGQNATYSLFVPKGYGNLLLICPGVNNLENIKLGCNGGFELISGQTLNSITANIVFDNGADAWKVSGLTGTGIMSLISGLKDATTSMQAGSPSMHIFTLGTNNGLLADTDSLVLAFDPAAQDFDLSSLTVSDITFVADSQQLTLAAAPGALIWGVSINTTSDEITITAPTSGTYIAPGSSLTLTVGGSNKITNPSTVKQYQITLKLINTLVGTEFGEVAMPIVDSDQVDITGAVHNSIVFDIDAGTIDSVDCISSVCQAYDGGDSAGNYTIDLGELKSIYVNRSQDTAVTHSDGGSGKINSIYLDLSTNATSGIVVYMVSANGGMVGPGTSRINAVTDGQNVTVNSNTYGYNLSNIGSIIYGSLNLKSECNTNLTYCGPTTTFTEVINSNNQALSASRVKIDLAAASGYTNGSGNYTDTLTFIAVANF